MRVAYLLNLYPAVSHIFIRREMLALERRGIKIMRIALRGWDSVLVDDEDVLERQRTRYVLRGGKVALLGALVRMALSRPILFMQAAQLAWRMSRRSDRPLHIHLSYLAEASRIEPWLRAAGIEHLHTHFGTNSAEVAMLVRALGGPSWSFTVHGPTEFSKVEFIGLPEKIRHCAFVVAISSYGRGQLYRFVDYREWAKVHVVHCGLEPFQYAAPFPVPAARRLVCLGRLCEQKGQILLVEAAHRLADKGVDFELVLVGDGEMRRDIENLIAHHKLEKIVRLTGRISSERVRHEMLSARALVLPSFAEGLPMVIMEAMAMGRPVISTFVAGIPELVRSGEHGWVLPAGDIKALMDAMETCLDAPAELLTKMGVAGHQRVLARHNVEIQAAKLADLFEITFRGSGVSPKSSPVYEWQQKLTESRAPRTIADIS